MPGTLLFHLWLLGIGSGLCLSAYLIFICLCQPQCTQTSAPLPTGLDHGICSRESLAQVQVMPFATCVTLGKKLKLTFYSSDVT